jgi:hypothetical protein
MPKQKNADSSTVSIYKIKTIHNDKDQFIVHIHKDKDKDLVEIFRHDKLLVSFAKPEKVFIGKSLSNPFTIYHKTNSKSYDGNTILIKPDNSLRYIYVGQHNFNVFYNSNGPSIEEFTTDSEITCFFSPVDKYASYPYAMTKNKIYLILEHIVLDASRVSKKLINQFSFGVDEPYSYYYKHQPYAHNFFGEKDDGFHAGDGLEFKTEILFEENEEESWDTN